MDDLGDIGSVRLRTHRILAFTSGMNMVSIALSVQLFWKAGIYAGYAPGLLDW